MKNILVAIDFDENLDFLIRHAKRFAKAFNAKIWLMHVAAPDPEFVGYDVGPQYIRDSRAGELREEHRVIQEQTDWLKKEGCDAEGLLIQGATIELIMEESKKLHIDMIMTGHHERSFLYNAFVGSVSAKIMKNSKIPVLIVPFK
ncbi:MAG: universal stress protein [Bacteroidia bacterium]|nr:universal stress protein [Bacteroidia bacterium]MBT8276981.1 universal stress protein [Bacteroidia bacterium]NNF31055.1 universal stress protein [Flavobacteriaceae bacterium]NNK55289.1 universal stress protein [Flavobacteriaceae bacterium]NNM09468.1 universal stress protein [Flavobacteriaceae bacterium]